MEPLTVPGRLDSLGTIREYVVAAGEEAGLDKKAAYRLVLAVDEIATNIIVHGYNEANLDGDVSVHARIDDESLAIAIEDTGEAFDPLQSPSPDGLDQPLEERQIGGLGVYLAIQNVDRFIYERVEDRNRNVFMMKRQKAA